MKLLIITQVVDTEHPVLGFFHRWIIEFAKNCEHVHVICLQEGKHDLPANVSVYSLGKEQGLGRVSYVLKFYQHIWKLREEYDQVFVHMNQVYVLLGWPIWNLLHKQIKLWYMHGATPFSLWLAERMVDVIYTGSKESFRLQSDKVIITGHGIDTEHFAPLATVEKDLDLITVGRITGSKNLIELVDIFSEIASKQAVTLSVVGAAITDNEQAYEQQLKDRIEELNIRDKVKLVGRVPQEELPQFLNRAKAFVTVAQNGSLDKAVLEAMACGLPVISMAPGSVSLPLNTNQVKTAGEMYARVRTVLEAERHIDHSLAEYVRDNHSIASLVDKLIES